MTADRCPECGSTDVRWRNRTRRHVVQNWLAYAFDSTIGKLLVGSTNSKPYSQSTPGAFGALPGVAAGNEAPNRAMDGARINEMMYDTAREEREFALGRSTPRRFWRCLSCKQNGRVYDDAVVHKAAGDKGR